MPREVHRGQVTGEAAAPVAQVLLGVEPGLLPGREVTEAGRRLRRLGRAAGLFRGFRGFRVLRVVRVLCEGGGDLVEEHAEPPGVDRDVVRHQEQRVLVRAQPDQQDADRRHPAQLEGRGGGRGEQFGDAAVALVFGQPREVDPFDRGACGVGEHLHGLAAGSLGDATAQCLVTAGHLVHGTHETVGVEGAVQPEGRALVVQGAAGKHLFGTPDRSLYVRQWGPVGFRARRDRPFSRFERHTRRAHSADSPTFSRRRRKTRTRERSGWITKAGLPDHTQLTFSPLNEPHTGSN